MFFQRFFNTSCYFNRTVMPVLYVNVAMGRPLYRSQNRQQLGNNGPTTNRKKQRTAIPIDDTVKVRRISERLKTIYFISFTTLALSSTVAIMHQLSYILDAVNVCLQQFIIMIISRFMSNSGRPCQVDAAAHEINGWRRRGIFQVEHIPRP